MTLAEAALTATARVLPIGLVAPPLGRAIAPRVVVTAILVAMVAPGLAGRTFDASALGRELLVGLALALVSAVPFAAARVAGASIDVARDAGGERPFGRAFGLLALAVFAALDGPRLLAVALGRSYLAFPVGGAPSANAGVTLGLDAGAQLVAAGLTLAAPALAALLLVELAAALVERAQPAALQLGLASSLRTLVVATVLALGTVALVGQLWSAGLRGLDDRVTAAAHSLAEPSK